MNDSRLQHALNHLDAADELIAAITSEGPANDRSPHDWQSLYAAGEAIAQAVSSVQGADSANYEGVSMKRVGR